MPFIGLDISWIFLNCVVVTSALSCTGFHAGFCGFASYFKVTGVSEHLFLTDFQKKLQHWFFVSLRLFKWDLQTLHGGYFHWALHFHAIVSVTLIRFQGHRCAWIMKPKIVFPTMSYPLEFELCMIVIWTRTWTWMLFTHCGVYLTKGDNRECIFLTVKPYCWRFLDVV